MAASSPRGDGFHAQCSGLLSGRIGGIPYQAALQPPAGEWTILRLAAADFVPTWRGRVVDHLPPLGLSRARQVGLLIADRQLGPFRLDLRTIERVR